MKRLLLISVCMLGFGISGPELALAGPGAYQSGGEAQTPPSPEQVVAMMSKKLSLTDDQKTQITPIIAERQQKMAALKANPPARKMHAAREAKSIMGDSDKKIEAVLNDQQKQQYAQMKEEMKEKAKEKKDANQ